MSSHARLALVFLVLTAINACSMTHPALRATSPPPKVVPSSPHDTVIVVGRIELVPDLTAEERQLRRHDPSLADKALAVFSAHPLDLARWPAPSPPSRVALPLGRDFMLPIARSAQLHYAGATVLLATAAAPGYNGRSVVFDDREMHLPGGFVVPLRSDDRAIYIGTLRYARDGFGAVRPLQVIDEYQQARSALVHTRGSDVLLRDVVPFMTR